MQRIGSIRRLRGRPPALTGAPVTRSAGCSSSGSGPGTPPTGGWPELARLPHTTQHEPARRRRPATHGFIPVRVRIRPLAGKRRITGEYPSCTSTPSCRIGSPWPEPERRPPGSNGSESTRSGRSRRATTRSSRCLKPRSRPKGSRSGRTSRWRSRAPPFRWRIPHGTCRRRAAAGCCSGWAPRCGPTSSAASPPSSTIPPPGWWTTSTACAPSGTPSRPERARPTRAASTASP